MGLLLIIVTFSFVFDNSEIDLTDYNNNNKNPQFSADLDGIENIIITKLYRNANITTHGLLSIEDTITFKNLNNHPITSIFFGIPIDVSEDLIFFKATGTSDNTLLSDCSSMIMNGNQMVVIYFDSPLLPYQIRSVKFTHTYKNIISYTLLEDDQHVVIYPIVYPLAPYNIEGEASAIFNYPVVGTSVDGGWGIVNPALSRISYDFDSIKDDLEIDFISPFLENLGERKEAFIHFIDNDNSKLEMEEVNREIFISPWGIIKVKEKFSLVNFGYKDINVFTIKIPKAATNLNVFDDLGEIQGTEIIDQGESNYKTVQFLLYINRVILKPNTNFEFTVEYNLPFENYVSLNWFEQSIQIDLLTTTYDFLGKNQIINVIIDACSSINSITESPTAIMMSKGATTLSFLSETVCPLERKIIQFTFTIDVFDILLRPITFILIISLIASTYVLLIKTRKKADTTILSTKYIPVNEIREFCSLYEEKNALTLEIRLAKDDTKRKKIAKKKYKNILTKNVSKIDEIQKEVTPFKKVLMETSEIFETIVKRLDILEAERISVKDSLALLESRYRRGRLPSRAAYLKLSDDFIKRRKKIDKTIDKLIQQLRSYLL